MYKYVVFDLDANGILNVSAVEKSSGKTETITVTNDKGRLSDEEVKRMVEEAEKYKEEDNKAKDRVESRNMLEHYLYQVKNTINDEKMKDKFTEDEKEMLTDKITEMQTWLEGNFDAEKEEYDNRRKELEELYNPIISKSAGGGMPSGMPDMSGMGMPDMSGMAQPPPEEDVAEID